MTPEQSQAAEVAEIEKRHEAHRDWMALDPPRLMAVSQAIEAYQDVAKLLAIIKSRTQAAGDAPVPDAWPSVGGPGGINPWFLDAAKFVALIQQYPHLWLSYSAAKYLNIRIDTRDGGFVLRGRDDEDVDMAKLLQAMRDNKYDGAYRETPRTQPQPAGATMPTRTQLKDFYSDWTSHEQGEDDKFADEMLALLKRAVV